MPESEWKENEKNEEFLELVEKYAQQHDYCEAQVTALDVRNALYKLTEDIQ